MATVRGAVHLSIYYVKVFEVPIYSQCVCSVGLMFGMMIYIGPKFYSVPPPPICVTYRSRSLTLIFI